MDGRATLMDRRPSASISPDVARLAAVRVPRYTSYPAATEFAADIGEDVYRRWLGEIAPDIPVSLYLHVPFCEELCAYCGCHTRVVHNPAIIAAYAERLIAEITAVADALPHGMAVSHLHWGGGTPSALGPAGLERVFEALTARFRLTRDAEHAMELDPRRVDRALIATLARLGVNRASLGVQTFDASVQAAIGRIQSFETVAAVTQWLRGVGIEAISFDVMYGLPHQTVENTRATIEQAVRLMPNRVSTFGYAHVPWMKKNQTVIDEAALPDVVERFRQMEALREALTERGYHAVGFDHFALPDDPLAAAARAGTLRRNFQGYTTDESPVLLGFGSSAIGSLPQGYVQNTADVRLYQERTDAGRLAVTRGLALTADDRTRAALIETVLCQGRADFGALTTAAETEVRAQLAPLAAQGLVDVSGSRLAVTAKGWPFVRLVAAAFDAYRVDTAPRHSLAV